MYLRSIRVLFSARMPFYAVAKGKKTGIYESWPECQQQVTGFKGPVFKKFETKEEAETFMQERCGLVIDKRSSRGQKPSSSVETVTEIQYGAKISDSKKKSALDPTLEAMKKEMKRLQKELSELRTRFDDYVEIISVDKDSTSKSVSQKRKISEDDEEPSKQSKLSSCEPQDSNLFTLDENGFLVVYTDGACESNGKKGARAGVGVYFGPDNPANVSEPVKGRATNNTAEIQAATYALELAHAHGFDKVLLNTDSQFLINCMTSWLSNWKKKDWKKSDGSPVINKEDLIDLDKASEGLMVKWNYVEAHKGIPGNEEADKLARAGALNYTSDD